MVKNANKAIKMLETRVIGTHLHIYKFFFINIDFLNYKRPENEYLILFFNIMSSLTSHIYR